MAPLESQNKDKCLDSLLRSITITNNSNKASSKTLFQIKPSLKLVTNSFMNPMIKKI